MSDEFRNAVRNMMNKSLTNGWVAEMRCGRTKFDQQYCFVVTKVVWYAVYLVTENSNYKSGISKEYKHLTLDGANEKIDEYRKKFDSRNLGPSIYCVGGGDVLLPLNSSVLQERKLPLEYVVDNPDSCICKGESILVERTIGGDGFLHHAGIYAGNEKVYHYTIEKEKKLGSSSPSGCGLVSWKDWLWPHGDEEILVVAVTDYLLRVRSANEILAKARALVAEKWGENQYDLMTRNCQHFASKCAVGTEFSVEMYEWKRRFYFTSDQPRPVETVVNTFGHLSKGIGSVFRRIEKLID